MIGYPVTSFDDSTKTLKIESWKSRKSLEAMEGNAATMIGISDKETGEDGTPTNKETGEDEPHMTIGLGKDSNQPIKDRQPRKIA
jgi:hypothetical protein